MMLNPSDPWSLNVTRGGVDALATVAGATAGWVVAVFQRSFYVELEAGLVCIGTDGLCGGPLNLASDAPTGTDWPASGLRAGLAVSAAPERLNVGPHLSFRLGDATAWRPEAAGRFAALDVVRGLSGFRAAARDSVPAEGLGALVFHVTESSDACRSEARAPFYRLNAQLRTAFQGRRPFKPEPSDMARLVGLGPGLTPSGDDALGGMMIALHALGEARRAADLWAAARPVAAANGNAISQALLDAASRGTGAAPVHSLMNAILKGAAAGMPEGIAAIDAIGHSSGWDAMAGVVSALDAWLHAAPLPATN